MRQSRVGVIRSSVISATTILLLIGCSSNTKPGATIPPLNSANPGSSASQSAPSSQSASSLGTLTPDSLSDPSVSYTVTEIPDGLSDVESEVLRAAIAYDLATWSAYRSMNGDFSQIEATTSGEELTHTKEVYRKYSDAGQHVEGEGSIGVLSVDVSPARDTATVAVCQDQTAMKLLSTSGENQTPDTMKHKFNTLYILTSQSSKWTVSKTSITGVDQC